MRVGIPICFATSNDGSHTESASIKDANDEIGSNSPKDTAALIDAILCKGYEYDFLYSNSPFTMYDSLLIQDEIFSELEKRPDAGSELLKKFFMLLNSSSNTTSTELDVSLKLSFIDLLLSQDVYQEKLTFSERERYISTLITQNDNPSYSVSSTSTKELVGRIHLPSGWKYYYRHPNDPEYTVTTIDGYKIELITTEDKLEEVDISYLNNSGASSNPNAVRIYPPNLLYNCHSYAWYQTSTSNKYWKMTLTYT